MILSNKELLIEKECKKEDGLYINKFTLLPEESFVSYDIKTFSPLINFLCKVTINLENFEDSNMIEPNDVWYFKLIEEFQKSVFVELKNKKENIVKKIKTFNTSEIDEDELIAKGFFSFLNTIEDKSFLDKFYFQDKSEIDIGEPEIVHNAMGFPEIINRNNPFITYKLLMKAEVKSFSNYSDSERVRFYLSLMGELMFETYSKMKIREPNLQKIGISSIIFTPSMVSPNGLMKQKGVMLQCVKKYK